MVPVPELTPELDVGKVLLRRSLQVHLDEPVAQRRRAIVHHGVAFPIILCTFPVRTDDDQGLTVLFQPALAALLVGELPHEENKSHILLAYWGKVTRRFGPTAAHAYLQVIN